jgi:hypothetical protein
VVPNPVGAVVCNGQCSYRWLLSAGQVEDTARIHWTGIIHIPGRWEDFISSTQNGVPSHLYELPISEIFYLMCGSWLTPDN